MMRTFTGPLHFFRSWLLLDSGVLWKRNKKVAIKPRRRRLTGAHLDLEWVVRFADSPHLVAEGEKTDERTNTPRCATAHACPRHSMPHLSLLAPHDGSVWPTVPPLLSSRLVLIGALDRDAQQPFCYASNSLGRACTSMHRTLAMCGASFQWRRSIPQTVNRDKLM